MVRCPEMDAIYANKRRSPESLQVRLDGPWRVRQMGAGKGVGFRFPAQRFGLLLTLDEAGAAKCDQLPSTILESTRIRQKMGLA